MKCGATFVHIGTACASFLVFWLDSQYFWSWEFISMIASRTSAGVCKFSSIGLLALFAAENPVSPLILGEWAFPVVDSLVECHLVEVDGMQFGQLF